MFTIGDKVWYKGAWGGDTSRPAIITGTGVHKGRVVYDNDLGHWGYESQYLKRSEVHCVGEDNQA